MIKGFLLKQSNDWHSVSFASVAIYYMLSLKPHKECYGQRCLIALALLRKLNDFPSDQFRFGVGPIDQSQCSQAPSNALTITAISSGPKAWSCSNSRMGIVTAPTGRNTLSAGAGAIPIIAIPETADDDKHPKGTSDARIEEQASVPH
jgi:hypothetical protein